MQFIDKLLFYFTETTQFILKTIKVTPEKEKTTHCKN